MMKCCIQISGEPFGLWSLYLVYSKYPDHLCWLILILGLAVSNIARVVPLFYKNWTQSTWVNESWKPIYVGPWNFKCTFYIKISRPRWIWGWEGWGVSGGQEVFLWLVIGLFYSLWFVKRLKIASGACSR